MTITPTHIATNKKTGKTILVEYDECAQQYRENLMVALVETCWDIKPIEELSAQGYVAKQSDQSPSRMAGLCPKKPEKPYPTVPMKGLT